MRNVNKKRGGTRKKQIQQGFLLVLQEVGLGQPALRTALPLEKTGAHAIIYLTHCKHHT
ncbi:hypothetical protein METBIDRAFT_219325 [Metschnikowia bicuspidata var. bicuspidata NRRL YB-4993]|uniref:Uncharacterized protein n=1 Tax=Metschnikowia bicuspidata var. bicuspidata NRRL YB-4993 TaxID=869754 RepID=A0A1A0H5F4_9ASCO|nr:hypothetical protein METBIDRAFT_219325 [Metschnikowia bicuspidata var. bicuspidata NRRL YB-4993]OBA19137.1 hypothetical protein METBIDRAFT_219325 [Metschnikowia bicuspidata var. bicuspidata NRRL YB-4993]